MIARTPPEDGEVVVRQEISGATRSRVLDQDETAAMEWLAALAARSHSIRAFDSSYAPEILIFRFTRWPSLAEQKALLKTLVKSQQLAPHSSGLLDITALQQLPDPD